SGAVLVLGAGPLAKRGFLRLIGWEAEGPDRAPTAPSRPPSEASGAAFLQERDEKRDRPLEASLPGAGRSSGASEAWPLRARRSSPARDAGGVTPIGPKPANVPRLASNPRRVPPA